MAAGADVTEFVKDPDEMKKMLGTTFREILAQRNITDDQLKELLNEYMLRLRAEDRAPRHHSAEKILFIQLKRDDMTWEIFCKGLEVIKAEVFTLSTLVTFEEESHE